MFKFVALLSAVTCAFAVTLPLAQRQVACDREYAVVPGDYCDKISATQHVTTYQLALNNPQINAACTNIFVDQVLCLGHAGKDCTDVHVVKPGDGCWAIFTEAGVTAATFYANNPNVASDCSNIYPDEVLCVADEVINYDA